MHDARHSFSLFHTAFSRVKLSFIFFFISVYDILLKSKPSGQHMPSKSDKRRLSGHAQTQKGVCITCYNLKRKKFTLCRLNKSTINRHKKSMHNFGENVEILPDEHPKVMSILNEERYVVFVYQGVSLKKITLYLVGDKLNLNQIDFLFFLLIFT